MADNLPVLDGSGIPQSIATKDLGGGVHASKHIVTNPDGSLSGAQSGLNVGQKAIATTNTAVALGSGALANGVVVKASAENAGPIFVGGSGVATTDDGTGDGYRLDAGDAMSFAVTNLSAVYINGTAGDFVYFGGN